uniref:RRM domain-containing protein n=1 Tax=Physcomitrium patens TaxID=3218 RepID=A0A7I4CMI5_PHYPA
MCFPRYLPRALCFEDCVGVLSHSCSLFNFVFSPLVYFSEMAVANMTMAVTCPRFVAVTGRAETNLRSNGVALSLAELVAASSSSMSCTFSEFSLGSKRGGLSGGTITRASDLEKELEQQLYTSITDEMMGSASSADEGVFGNDGIASPGMEVSAGSGEDDVAAPVAEEQLGSKVYVGNLPWTCDSAQLAEICSQHGTVDVVEVIYDKLSGRSRGFAFVTMASHDDAQALINALDGSDMGGRALKVNFPQSQKDKPRFEKSEARPPTADRRPRDDPNKLFVGNIPWGCDEAAMTSLFSPYGSVVDAKIVYDRDSGRSRGFGFVTMEKVGDAQTAMENLDGTELDGRELRVNFAGEKPPSRSERPSGGDRKSRDGPNKLFVGNLSWGCDETALESLFSDYGRVVEARIAYDKDSGRSRGFGFVTLSNETEVNTAIENLDGAEFDARQLRVNLAGDKPAPRY